MSAQSDSPLVSVITATYNWSSVLRYAIQSVLWQTVQDFEMLIIGDGCTDDSADVVASFNDHRLRWHNLAENSGHQSVPNNTGLAMARGQYVAYLGHDDLWYPTHLEHLLRALREQAGDLAFTVSILIGPPGSRIKKVQGLVDDSFANLIVPPSSVMHTRSLVDAIGPWKEYRTIDIAPDADFYERAFQYGCRLVEVGQVTVFKFPSTWRPGAYRDKPSYEQSDYARRIQTEPDLIFREVIEVLRAYKYQRTTLKVTPPRPKVARLGWQVEQIRRLRGLDPRPLPPLSTRQQLRRAIRTAASPLGRVLRIARRFTRHVLYGSS